MLKKVLLGIGLVVLLGVGLLVIVVAMQPSEFRITRTATIGAPVSAVFAEVNNLHHWQDWSPWAKRDPNAKTTFEGPDEGTGAVFRWKGNEQIGAGSMTITESQPNKLVRFNLHFTEPWESTSTAELTFEPQGDKTAVTWVMFGPRSFLEKAVCLFLDMDAMVGGDFEQGLANLESVVRKRSSSPQET
jgi:hypothetical protein